MSWKRNTEVYIQERRYGARANPEDVSNQSFLLVW